MSKQSNVIESKTFANESGVEADGLYFLIARTWRGRLLLANLGTELGFFFLVFAFNSRDRVGYARLT
jgi:hypothetical protein